MDERNRDRNKRPPAADGERTLWRPRVWVSNTRRATDGGLPPGSPPPLRSPGGPSGGQPSAPSPYTLAPPTYEQTPPNSPPPVAPRAALGSEDGELNPPWERESARYPAVNGESG